MKRLTNAQWCRQKALRSRSGFRMYPAIRGGKQVWLRQPYGGPVIHLHPDEREDLMRAARAFLGALEKPQGRKGRRRD